MWVYQGTQNEMEQPSQALVPGADSAASGPERPPEPPKTDAGAVRPTPRPPQNRAAAARPHSGQATRDCILLAAAYLLGTTAAGALQALCDANELEALHYYLSCWCSLFTLDGTRSIAALFGTEYFAAAVVVTLLLLLGLSAFGPMPIFFFMMLYGTGIGLLAAQLFSGITPKIFAAYVLIAGLPAAVAAACICMFGASALQVCSRLHSFSFARQGSASGTGAGARGLLGQYALVMVLFVPLSGAATGLVYLANHLHLW